MVLKVLTVIGLCLIAATEACLWIARRQHSRKWELIARFVQCGVVVVYSAIVFAALGDTHA